MSQRIASLVFVVIAVVLGLGTSPAAADDTDVTLARLADAAKCKNKASPWRAWCPATTWAKGKAGALKPGVMAGITVAIAADADVQQALTERVTFVVLAVRRDGKKLVAALRDVKPENDSESEMVAKAVMGVAAVLKGKAKEVVLDKDLRDFADSLVAQASRDVAKTRTGWIWDTDDNHVELRQVGTAWVVIETPKTGGAGRFVTVLTPREK
jgi:hypothetical protein